MPTVLRLHSFVSLSPVETFLKQQYPLATHLFILIPSFLPSLLPLPLSLTYPINLSFLPSPSSKTNWYLQRDCRPQRTNREAYIHQTNTPCSFYLLLILLFQASLGRRTQRRLRRYIFSFFLEHYFAFFKSHIYFYFWFIFIYFHLFSFIFIYFHLFSFIFFYFHLFSFIFIYFHLFSFIFFYFLLFSFIFFYFLLFSFIFFFFLFFSFFFLLFLVFC